MNINHILFAVDFSKECQAMNGEVEWLAARFQARVTLLNVFEVPPSWYGGTEAPLFSAQDFVAYADAERNRLQNYSIHLPESQLERKSVEGSPASEITKWASELGADLIVMGTHGYGVLQRVLLGSVTVKVLHQAECPVWTHASHDGAKRNLTLGISRILCPIEPGEEAVSLLRYTADLTEDLGASVQLVHCVPEMESRPARYFDRDLHNSLKDRAREEICRLQKTAGTDFPLQITEGFIAQDIAILAAEQHADLVIAGRGKANHPLGTLRTHVFEIVRQAPCPVLSFAMHSEERPAQHALLDSAFTSELAFL